MKKYSIAQSIFKYFFAVKDQCWPRHLLTFVHVYDFIVQTKKLGELCSISVHNCVGDLVCQKIEDDCNNGVGICQPKGRKKCSLVVN